MRLEYAVERLYQTGWLPMEAAGSQELERLPDGRMFPSVLAVQQEFARHGLELSIKYHLMFRCYRAVWHPADELDQRSAASGSEDATDDRRGVVVGGCDREAAVYALAQLRASAVERPLQTA